MKIFRGMYQEIEIDPPMGPTVDEILRDARQKMVQIKSMAQDAQACGLIRLTGVGDYSDLSMPAHPSAKHESSQASSRVPFLTTGGERYMRQLAEKEAPGHQDAMPFVGDISKLVKPELDVKDWI